MKLIYEETGKEVKIGDVVIIDRKRHEVTGIQKPHKPSSTGRVYVEAKSKKLWGAMSYFPSVIGAKWIEREDQNG
jgi:uncharacterized Zn finger protein